MLDALVERAREMGVSSLRGRYIPTKKNAMVRDHYHNLGFATVCEDANGSAIYSLEIAGYTSRGTHIKVLELVHE